MTATPRQSVSALSDLSESASRPVWGGICDARLDGPMAPRTAPHQQRVVSLPRVSGFCGVGSRVRHDLTLTAKATTTCLPQRHAVRSDPTTCAWTRCKGRRHATVPSRYSKARPGKTCGPRSDLPERASRRPICLVEPTDLSCSLAIPAPPSLSDRLTLGKVRSYTPEALTRRTTAHSGSSRSRARPVIGRAIKFLYLS